MSIVERRVCDDDSDIVIVVDVEWREDHIGIGDDGEDLLLDESGDWLIDLVTDADEDNGSAAVDFCSGVVSDSSDKRDIISSSESSPDNVSVGRGRVEVCLLDVTADDADDADEEEDRIEERLVDDSMLVTGLSVVIVDIASRSPLEGKVVWDEVGVEDSLSVDPEAIV
ncbi:hypothetical protein LPJ64_003704 [Coemansia asiatica]|uniref:Uncharacterized protein n=1 Tax=Coemansia asiatica TaxID=1052880 RepID=A0A9W8CJR8_9FUNG|nr:hypothetical protein LPJ64_003704 [Coemansia asiatica]